MKSPSEQPGPPASGAPAAPPAVDLNPDDPTGSLASGNDATASEPASEPASDAASPQAATIGHIGRYGLKQRLGEGGLGTVYAAYDPILSRTIAVKTLHLSVVEGDRAALDALFLNEARAAAGLNHPNIVTVYDAGLSEQGVYIAMERLRGRDLRQLLSNGWRPDIVQAAQIVRRVADALSYAHSKGVIHCDIKPANIFMVGRTLPKVVDFGIARVAHGQVIPALEGVVAGSPHYLAPEQLRGETIDRRCDVYSLGVVMYELLTHRKAFSGQSLPEIVDAVQNSTPPDVHEVRPEVPASLAAIVHKAMARDPAQRYRSARQLSQELRQWIDHEGGELGDDLPTLPAWRRPWAVGAAVAAMLAVTIGWWWMSEPVTAPVEIAAAPVATSRTTPAPVPAPVASQPATVTATATEPKPTPAALKSEPAPVSKPRPAAPPAAERTARAAKAVPAAPAKPAAPLSTGVVQLAIAPWGQVEVNGAPAGVTPPLARLTLPVGEHVVTVRNEDFPPYTARVKVSTDGPVTVRHRFGS